MRCKADSSKTTSSAESKSYMRKAFVSSIRGPLLASPKISSIEVNGRDLEIVGKNGLDTKTVSSTFLSAMGEEFKSNACILGFVGMRVRKDVSDKGIYSSLNCGR